MTTDRQAGAVIRTDKLKHKHALIAQLASNEARPAKAADTQETVQVMFWKLEARMGRWVEEHGGQALPTAGTTAFRTEILNSVFKDVELKEGTANFLFTKPENLRLVQDLWQLAYFKIAGCVPLPRLSAALGRVGKKDLAKKSGSAMVSDNMPAPNPLLSSADMVRPLCSYGGG